MKKEIVINASKDRARIAIVEDGELVELYVEHPDNVRTLGNIYLGKVAKVMPQIHAAFVDIGQRQDAFLHFSDLTDNAAQLFAIAGMDVPGLESGPILAKAPKKRVDRLHLILVTFMLARALTPARCPSSRCSPSRGV